MRRRNNRLILFIMVPIFFLLFLIGYMEPGVESTETNNKLEETKEFNARTVDNIKTFAKLYGYVRYFHPSDEAAELDWESFLVFGVQQVIDVKNTKELEDKLKKLFSPIAPTLQIYRANESPKKLSEMDGSNLIAWQHYGLDMSKYPKSGFVSKRIISELNNEIKLFDYTLPTGTLIQKSLNAELKAQIPIVLTTDNNGTLGNSKDGSEKFEKFKLILKYVKHDERTKYLVNTILTWNVFQHFYPYFDLVDINWDSELEKTLTNILHSKNTSDYEQHFQVMLAGLGDGQLSALDTSENNFLPFNMDWIENELIVTASESDEVQIGDRIVKINGMDSKEFVSQFESEISGSVQWKKYQAIKETLTSAIAENELTLEINRDGNILDKIKVTYHYFILDDFNRSNKEPIYEMEDGIFYINQTLISDYQFGNYVEKLATAKGIIIDLRGNPEYFKVGNDIISHLINTPVKSAISQVPKIIYPDREKIAYETSEMTIEPASPKFTGKIVYLAYNGTISSSEIFLDIVKDNKLAEIVGQETAGASGRVNTIRLLDSQHRIYWTGSKVLKPDGSQHQLLGVKPTIPVKRTIEAIKLGKDEYIEKALEVIKSN